MWHGGKSHFAFLLVLLVLPSQVWSATPIDEVSTALHELQQWLGADENAENWNRFLHNDDLAVLIGRGTGVDRQQVAPILEAYSADHPGLKLRRFVAVRKALEDWMAEIPIAMTDLPEALRAAQGEFRVAPADEVQQSRQQLQSAVQRLDQFLSGSTPENVAAWKQYLRWDAMEAELTKDPPNPGELVRMSKLYGDNYSGLELPYFADVRDGLQNYGYAIYFSQAGPAQEAYKQHLEEVAKHLESYLKAPNTDDSAAIGRSLGWLERGSQVPQLIRAGRSGFSRPNLFALASQRLIAAGGEDAEVQEKLNRPQVVNDYILKASIHGTAYPQLSVNLSLVPNDDRAEIDVQILGGASNSSVGYRGPVTVYTSGYTSIEAAKRVYIDEQGISSGQAWAACATSTNINDIAARCRLIEKFAWQQAGKSKGQAEQIASSRAASRIGAQLDNELNGRLAEANQSYAEKFRNRLLRRDSFPQQFRLSTTEEAVYVKLLHATPLQLSANTDPPPLEGNHDLAVRLHESFVINMGESLIGGMTLTDERLVEILQESKSEIPEELQITPDKDPWSITFTQEKPVSAQFADNLVKLAIRGERFTRGERQVRAIMEISATYKLEKSGNGSKLTRQGDVSAEYVNQERESSWEVAMKTLMRKKFESLFKPELTSDGLVLPDRLSRIGKLQLQQLTSDKGWLLAGWLKPDAAEVAGAE